MKKGVKGGRVTISPRIQHRNCRPPGCPGIHRSTEATCRTRVPGNWRCPCGKFWVATANGFARLTPP